MDRFIIDGGLPLEGEVQISGAKNSVLPIFAATLLAHGPCRIENVPELRDVTTMLKVLERLGCNYRPISPGVIHLDASSASGTEAPYDLVRTMRASFIVLGPLLARHGVARVSMPGGCAIGLRGVDLHLKGLQALGARIEFGGGYVEARCDRLKGADFTLEFPSVGATENIMLAASTAEGNTVLRGAAREPEIADLANFLNEMGAEIRGAGTDTIHVTGVKSLGGCTHRIIPDRIETGTFALAAAITRGHLRLHDAPVEMLDAVIETLRATGAELTVKSGYLDVKGPKEIRPVNISTAPHPGFPTDLQAPFMAYMTLANGTGTIAEKIFENRFLHVAELRRMGGMVRVQNANGTIIEGVPSLSGAQVMASDLRAGAALVLAALAAKGRTEISRVYHIDRGYVQMEQKLRGVGAQIIRDNNGVADTNREGVDPLDASGAESLVNVGR
jgi:UDP-N-acetylglucosamine 1-carboxyvinyltransferase